MEGIMRKSTPFLVAIALIFGTVACSDNPFEPTGDLGISPGVTDEDPIHFPVERPLADNGELKEVDEDEI
jgi:hypothetical protein